MASQYHNFTSWVQATAEEWEEQGYSEGFAMFKAELLRPLKRTTTSCTDTLSLRPKNPKMAFILWNVICFWVGIVDVLLALMLEHGFAVVVVLCAMMLLLERGSVGDTYLFRAALFGAQQICAVIALYLLIAADLSIFAILIAVVDGLLGYAFAYTFYFLFITTGPCTKLWMFRGLLVILSYVIGTGVLTYLALGRVGLIEEQTGETYAEVMTEIGLEGAKCAANMVVLYHALLLYNAQPNDASTSAITSMMV